jgi:hypothetical protein
MYYLVRYKKPAKHIVGVENETIGHIGPFQTLLAAERQFLKDCKTLEHGSQEGFRLDDARYNSHREYYNPTNGLIYVKTNDKNEFDKYTYHAYSLQAYSKWMNQKAKNPFTKVI